MQRFILWCAAILVALIAVILLPFKLSPWPSVAIIAYRVARSDRASDAALEKHVPGGVISRRNIAYGATHDEVCDVYYPEGTNAPRPTIVWVHGGGFVAGSKDGIANYMKLLAGRGYTTIAPEYSKGYGTTYPKPVEQVNAALGFIVRHAADLRVDPGMIVLAGDSAGAHISGQVGLITTDPSYSNALNIAPELKASQLSAMLLFSGAYDPSAVNFEGDYAWFLQTVLWAYSGMKTFRQDARSQLMSVTAHVTRDFPPTFISSGNGDPLAPQAIVFAQHLKDLGVRVDSLFFSVDRRPPLPHEYQFNLDEPAGQQALNRMLAFLAAVRHAGSPTAHADTRSPGQSIPDRE